MRLNQIAQVIDGQIVVDGAAEQADVDLAFACDTMSDLLNAVSERSLLVTRLRGPQVVHAAELLDVPGICLVGDEDAGGPMTEAACERGILLMRSLADMEQTCRRLRACNGLAVRMRL